MGIMSALYNIAGRMQEVEGFDMRLGREGRGAEHILLGLKVGGMGVATKFLG
jgi:hypothetical protein